MKYFYSLMVFTAMLVLSGCASPYTDVRIVRAVEAVPPISEGSITYETDFLPYTLPLSQVNTVRLNDKRIKVQVQLKNVTNATQVFAYKFEWFDRNGMVANDSMWQEQIVLTDGDVTLEATPPSINYEKFKLTLRSAQLLRIIRED